MWIIDEKVYQDRAYAGWLGKNIGGTLGTPVEGTMKLLNLTFYPELPQGEPMPNDDLDLQLVWLYALEQCGPGLTIRQLGQAWTEHVFFPFDEYGYALHNLRRGIVPPVSGWFNNPFADCMGAPIRSEIWAMIAPGLPELAAFYAWQDAVVDHAGGEGVWGEMLFAAIQSAAFIESDPMALIETGLSLIPPQSRVAKAVRHLLEMHAHGIDWKTVREHILRDHGRSNFTDAPQNIAFTLLGWLYGEDFEDAVLKAVNCGYDTDCTAATLGAILGIIGGVKGIPDKWVAPIGNKVALSPAIRGIDYPKTLEQLTERTLNVAKETLAAWRVPMVIGNAGHLIQTGYLVETGLPIETGARIPTITDRPRVDVPLDHLVAQSPTAFSVSLPYGADPMRGGLRSTNGSKGSQGSRGSQGFRGSQGLTVTVDYGPDGPAMGRSATRSLSIDLHNGTGEPWTGLLELDLPDGWRMADARSPKHPLITIEPGKTFRWQPTFQSGDGLQASFDVVLKLHRTYDGERYWKTQSVPIALVPTWYWVVRSPDGDEQRISSPTSDVPFLKENTSKNPGWWHATTVLYSPVELKVVVIVATPATFKAVLRGEVILDAPGPRPYMPAFHRPVAGTAKVVKLHKGHNELRIEVMFAEGEAAPVKLALVNPTTGVQHPETTIVSVSPPSGE